MVMTGWNNQKDFPSKSDKTAKWRSISITKGKYPKVKWSRPYFWASLIHNWSKNKNDYGDKLIYQTEYI